MIVGFGLGYFAFITDSFVGLPLFRLPTYVSAMISSGTFSHRKKARMRTRRALTVSADSPFCLSMNLRTYSGVRSSSLALESQLPTKG